jgi:hypothetical protein
MKRQRRHAPKRKRSSRSRRRSVAQVSGLEVEQIESLRTELQRIAATEPPRWNANADDVRKSVAKLVLTLIEFIRQLLERQALRRMEAGTLTADQTESVGLALMRLEETIRDIGAQFDLSPEDLNLDLGPIGKLTGS